MANVNITNTHAEEKLDRSISKFERSMEELTDHLGGTREVVENQIERAKDVMHKPREIADRAAFEIRLRPVLYVAVSCAVGLALGLLAGGRRNKKAQIVWVTD